MSLSPWLPLLQAQQAEPSLPLSQRSTINLSAGVPQYIGSAASTSSAPQSPWLFENTANSTQYSTQNFIESTDGAAHWQPVGVPYDANIPRTFINQKSGGGDGSLTGNQNWYRLHFKVDPKYAGQKFLLNLEGSHTAVQVFINGNLLPGISQVTANAQATHVVGFIPVVVDLTPYIHADGTTDNVIAIDVSRGDPWFEQPGFSGAFRFGQAMAGLFRNVFLYVTNPVHIPVNVYSNQKTWGTYVGTKSIVASQTATATATSAVVEVQTNVLNESNTTQQVTLTTQIVDASGNVVVTAPPLTQTVGPMTAATFPSGPEPMFDQTITVPNPTLWYPNNSIYGKPYMYRVYHIVSVNGTVVDAAQSPLGIRTLTWDNNFPYFNGHQHYLWGASGRYDYPGLGSAVPDEQVWRDLAQFAAGGGNVWRPGHSTSSEEFVAAADAYGIMIDQPSGDGEGHWSLSSSPPPSADDLQLKQELHRDMIIRDRSHPSILDWEEDNGGNNATLAAQLDALEQTWDTIQIRKQATRSGDTSYAYINECDQAGCEIASKQNNEQFPAFGAEYWDNVGTGRGLAYDNELAFAAPYLDDWRRGRAVNTFGMAQWYFADTPGEISLWSEYQNTPNMVNFVRSLGYSEVDQNRFPRLLYYIYEANWVPFSIKPVVALAHHWNRAYEYTQGTPIQVNAFSNCPAVRLLINGIAKDPLTGDLLADQVPNAWDVNSSADLTQNTTVMPGQVHWMVNFAPGNLTAQCLDNSRNPVSNASDTRITAGAEHKIVLTAVSGLQKPDGTSFQWTSNGSDAAFVVAQVVDAQGNLVPTAADNVTFSVSGPAQYMGGTQQIVADPTLTNYYQDAFSQANSTVINGVPYAFFHSPGDPELNFEGGLQKIALRSTFTPGAVTVTASAPGLIGDSVTLTSVAPPPPATTQAPAIIVPPVSTAVTQGQTATFTVSASGSGTLNYQWFLNNNQVAGANGTSFTTAATTLADNNDSIMVTVTSASGFGSVSSNPAILSVSAPEKVAITTSPVSQTSVVGQTATFTVVASGSPQLTYTWFKNNAQVATGPLNTYTTPLLTTPETDTYFVIVSNPLNQVQSGNATLTVAAPVPVSITGSPVSQTVASNQPVVLNATVAGSAPYTYQWSFTPKGGQTIIVASDTQLSNVFTFNLPAMSASNAGAYTITVNNAANLPETSAIAQLTLAPPGVNLAFAKPATASSSQQLCTDPTTAPSLSGANCLGAENAVDGSLATRWASASAGTTATTVGVDPSDLIIDLGATQPFNTIVINWENAYATGYEIDYTNEAPTANTQWIQAVSKTDGGGSTETLNFATVQGRYVRMHGTQRATQYGYSILEFQVYNIAQCGGPNERYTLSSTDSNKVLDNLLNLTWTRTVKTGANASSQFTGVSAVDYCSTLNMRIPTKAEALSIGGNNNASCAFQGAWSTWTSTVNPTDSTETAIVSFNGNVTQNVTNNFPGATLCTTGTFAGQAPVITLAPQPATVTLGQSAAFSVAATGVPSPTYQWFEGNAAISGATEPTYITPPTASTDNNATFTVAVTNGSGTVTTTPVALTVSTTPVGPTEPTGPNNPPPPNNPGAVTTPTGSPTNPANPVIPADPANSGNGNTNSTDTMITGFGTGPVPVGPNLALGGAAKSTGDEADGLGPMNAVDGNAGTRWSSAFANASDMQVDLGAVQPVGQVLLRWERSYGFQYQIRVSADGVSWTPVFTQTQGLGGTENLVFPGVNARYVQFHGIQRSSQYGYSLWEMEVYGPVAPVITTQPVNQTVLAGAQAQFTVVASGQAPFTYQWQLNGTAITGANSATYTTGVLSASDANDVFNVIVKNAGGSTLSSNATLAVTNPVAGVVNLALRKPTTSSGDENANLGPLNATDGDLTTRWSSTADNNAYLQVDLGAAMLVNKVVLYWEAAYGLAYQIQVSNDLQTWTTVYTQTAGTGGVETPPSFPAVIARYVRMQGVTRATQYGYSLYEFQIFGADVPQIVTQPASQTVAAGATATFTVAAGGTGPFTYQWLLNNLPIKGATAATYTTGVLQSGDSGGSFTVAVTNASGTSTSMPALVTVNASAPVGPNLALHKLTTESSTQNEASLGSAFAVDGDLTTRWSSDFVPTAWIEVDLGSAQTINQVLLNWEAAYAQVYSIQTSNDGTTWNTILTKQNGQGGTENLTFAPVSARYVRMFGTQRATQYGYSLYEFQVFGPTTGSGTGTGTPLSITTQPANQSATVGSTATFSVTAAGTGPLTYQWLKGGAPITGATSATYTTPTLSIADNATKYSVVIGNASGTATVTSSSVTLSVAAYVIFPGALGIDLVNNTKGAWTNNQVYVTVIGMDPNHNNAFSYVNANGQIVDFTLTDNAAANHLTGPDGLAYGSYSFTLAQVPTLKLPPITSARAFISLGAPLYVQINGDTATGKVTGYAGPNPDNLSDPNLNTHLDWYEFNYALNADGSTGIFINTTQVNQFGLPLVLDVWANGGSFHQQVGITESIAQIDSEFAAEVPAAFQPATMSNLRIFSPAELSMAKDGANGNYFDNVVQTAWTSYTSTPITINLAGRQYKGSASGPTLTFTEVNPAQQNAGETFVVQQPSTQEILLCNGSMNSGVDITGLPGSALAAMQSDEDAVQRQLQNQICSATNRGILLKPSSTWANAATYYGSSPANSYSQFWHNHSIGGFAYGFSYDDNNNQSTTISTGGPEHMTWTVNW